MRQVLFELWHYHVGPGADVPPLAPDGGKLLGLHSTLERATGARNRLSDRPGFADWPGGFRLLPTRIGHRQWAVGFSTQDRETGEDIR